MISTNTTATRVAPRAALLPLHWLLGAARAAQRLMAAGQLGPVASVQTGRDTGARC
jgi:hypothetical protein